LTAVNNSQGLYGADYAPKSWVNDKDYATESYVDGAVVTGGAIGVLIDVALTRYASTTQLGATNQSIRDLTDAVDAGFVPVLADWYVLSSPDGLNLYVASKVGTGTLREPIDWASCPSGNFGGLDSTLKILRVL
jgi:hypothetical protein